VLTPLILAQRVLDLFEESGATPAERDTALDVVEAIVRRNRIEGDALLPLLTGRFDAPDDQDAP
jgi:hypothetical protein